MILFTLLFNTQWCVIRFIEKITFIHHCYKIAGKQYKNAEIINFFPKKQHPLVTSLNISLAKHLKEKNSCLHLLNQIICCHTFFISLNKAE